MASMSGIPKGTPKPFTGLIPNDACYAFAQIVVKDIEFDALGRYGFVSEGVNFVDSVLLDEIRHHVRCSIEIVNGYYFNEGFNSKICSFAQLLYQMRSLDLFNKLGKNMLSALYGKSLQSCQQFKIKMVPRSKVNEYLAEFGNYVYEITRAGGDMLTVKLLRSIDVNYNIPQFGSYVLSESRARMNRVITFCNVHEIPIYSIKTDSFTLPSKDVEKLTTLIPIGVGLGEFRREYEAKYVKYVSAGSYKAELTDGTTRVRGQVE